MFVKLLGRRWRHLAPPELAEDWLYRVLAAQNAAFLIQPDAGAAPRWYDNKFFNEFPAARANATLNQFPLPNDSYLGTPRHDLLDALRLLAQPREMAALAELLKFDPMTPTILRPLPARLTAAARTDAERQALQRVETLATEIANELAARSDIVPIAQFAGSPHARQLADEAERALQVFLPDAWLRFLGRSPRESHARRTPGDLARARRLPITACPRRYCWYWHSIDFDWPMPPAEGCSFPESETHDGRSDPRPCRRTGVDSGIDRYEPRDPYLIDDELEPDPFLAPPPEAWTLAQSKTPEPLGYHEADGPANALENVFRRWLRRNLYSRGRMNHYGVAVHNLSPDHRTMELEITFRRDRAYCCAEPGCNFGFWSARDWQRIREYLGPAGLGHLGPLRIHKLRVIVEAGARLGAGSLPLGKWRDAQHLLQPSPGFSYECGPFDESSPEPEFDESAQQPDL